MSGSNFSLRRRTLAAVLGMLVSSVQAATVMVTSTADSVAVDTAVTFREALLSFNRGSDVNSDIAAHRSGTYGASDRLRFAIASGAQTISPSSPLPAVLKPLQIDGTSQSGYVDVPLITLDGASAGTRSDGLTIAEHTGSVVNALTVTHFGADGVWISTHLFADSFDLPQPADLASRPAQTPATLDSALRDAVGSRSPSRVAIVQTSAATNILTNVVSSSNGGVGIRVDGALETNGGEVLSNAGDGVWVDSAAPIFLTDADIHGNGRNGIRVLRDSDSAGFIVNESTSSSTIHDNVGNGIVLGDALAQTGAVNALIVDSFVDGNQIGIEMQQRDATVAATQATIVDDLIHVNRGAGVHVHGATFRSTVYAGITLSPFSKNDIEHNGFPAGDTTCSANESVAQIVFDGPAGVAPAIASACQAATTQGDCDAAASGACVFNSTIGQCNAAYLIQGGTVNACIQQTANIITGYAGESATGTSGANVVGVTAINGAWVNASVNTWKHSTPTFNIDVSSDAASLVQRIGACQGRSTCLP